jgi:hypothetical protein
MNRYALEMHAREKYQNSAADPSSQRISMPVNRRGLGFFSRNVARLNDYQSEPIVDSMTFIYELRSDFVHLDLDFDQVLPMIK